MAAGSQDKVRLDERLVFTIIEMSNGEIITGKFWLTRGMGDLQGQLGATLTDGDRFWPLGYVRSFSIT